MASAPITLLPRILLVEDHEPSQHFACAALEGHGLLVDVAVNGVEAIAALSTKDYAMVLMDCVMSVMGGVEATQLIRDGSANARNPDIPIIAITANVYKENFDDCKLAGMDDWLVKPMRADELREMVAKWLEPGNPKGRFEQLFEE